MEWIDMHCDTLSRLQRGKGTLLENPLCVDVERLKQSGALAQFFACFVDAGNEKQREKQTETDSWENAYKKVEIMLQKAHQEAALAGEAFCFVKTEKELRRAYSNGSVAGILTVEEGGVLNGKIKRLKELYEQGVRLITLTWNYENCIGSPNSRDLKEMTRGLTAFGKQAVEQMNDLGMLIDVSHLSDGGFWDCIRMSRSPVVASHSNARALCRHPRNLSDEMLRSLGEHGGVAGVNFYSAFLRERKAAGVRENDVLKRGALPQGAAGAEKERTEKERAQIGHIVRHIMWIMDKAGEDAVALGSDFDGFGPESLPDGIRGAQDMGKLWQALERAGATQRQIDKIASENVRRVLKEVCG